MIEILQLLNAKSDVSTRYSKSYYVRHLSNDEPLEDFGHGIPDTPLLQREWVWVAFDKYNNKPLALLSACPAHHIVILLRTYAIKDAPKSILVGLLRKSLADIYSRGYNTYATYLDRARPEEHGLERIAIRAGARIVGGDHIAVSGSTDIGDW